MDRQDLIECSFCCGVLIFAVLAYWGFIIILLLINGVRLI
jgi:hypothetical protein